MAFEPLFLTVAGAPGQRFGVYHPARGGRACAAVLHVHAFAEEQNKARRMVARQARAFADAGIAVLLIDLLGCGDSPGDFEQARWDTWIADVRAGAAWLRARSGGAPLWLWGLRAGCLLVSEAAAGLDCAGWLLWQPPLAGRALGQQFLRMKLAAGVLSGQGGGGAAALREELKTTGRIEVAGYTLPAQLLAGLEGATLRQPPAGLPVHWLELDDRPDATLLPPSQQRIALWTAAGVDVRPRVVAGPPFWQVTELEDAPALIAASVAALAAAPSAAAAAAAEWEAAR